jgi:succinate dehydrogenase hydrophobic anchor subunit
MTDLDPTFKAGVPREMMCPVSTADLETVTARGFHQTMILMFRWRKQGLEIFLLENILADLIHIQRGLQLVKRDALHHHQEIIVQCCTVWAAAVICTSVVSPC